LRARALLTSIAVLALAAPAAHAQDPATGGTDSTSTTAAPDPGSMGGAEYGVDPNAVPRVTVPGVKAKRLPTGFAAAPADAPVEVQEAIWAANDIVGLPYKYGGGHGRSFKDTGYDCSGTVSYALKAAGLLKTPLDSSSFMSWGERGKGDWITVYTNPGHAFAVIAGLRLDTSAAGERRSSGKGPRWRSNLRGGKGFKIRSPKGF
jgi:cell wall-associated NlpC family hydrolase